MFHAYIEKSDLYICMTLFEKFPSMNSDRATFDEKSQPQFILIDSKIFFDRI